MPECRAFLRLTGPISRSCRRTGGFFLLSIFFSVLPAVSLEWRFAPTDSSILLPEQWQLYDDSESGRVSFISQNQSIIFQISVYPGNTYTSDLDMMESHLNELQILETDSSRFEYRGKMVSLSDSTFQSSDSTIRGWFLFIDREDYDYYLTGITPEEMYDESFPWILSCLDSFSPDEAGRQQPGAIGTFLTSDKGGEKESLSIDFLGTPVRFEYKKERREAAQLLIEREASILSSYQEPEVFAAAWKRYYQLIYRDTSADMETLANALSGYLEGKDDIEKAEMVLEWLQGFEYGSSDSFSDLLAPLSVIIKKTGDCDALGLVYCHMMDKMGIPSLLMVSYIYSHSMAAVGIDRSGAGFSYGEERFVVAEMTKKVDIGMISREMADMNNWIIISPNSPHSKIFSIIK